MRAPPRKYNDFGGFGRPPDRMGPTGTQRHDKHVRPPAGCSAGTAENFDTPGAQRRAADCLRFASPAEATGRLGEIEAGRI